MKTQPPDLSDFFDDADELEARRSFMASRGYRFCSMPACNCNSWHEGHAENLLAEVSKQLQSYGLGSYYDEYGNLNGFSIGNAIDRLAKEAGREFGEGER